MNGIRGADTTRRSANGFTLVELLISLAVGGLVITGILSLVFGQNRFYERSDDAMHAQRNVRTAAELMSSELRMASPEDLIVAIADSVAVRFDIIRAMACDSTGADEATAFAYDSVTTSLVGGGGFFGTAYTNPYDSAWAYADGWFPTTGSTGAVPRATCTAAGAPATGTDNTYATLTGWAGNFTDGVPDAGSLLRFYTRLSYVFKPAVNFGTGTALWRGSAELIAPFASGAAFSYVMANGSVLSSVASGNLPNVRAIRVTATAEGDGANRDGVDRDLQFDIPLRN